LSATFTALQYQLVHDDKELTCPDYAYTDESVTATVLSKTGYTAKYVKVTVSSLDYEPEYLTPVDGKVTFKMGPAFTSAYVEYTPNTYSITAGNGITVQKTAKTGETVEAVIASKVGYTIGAVKLNGTSLTLNGSKVSFEMPATNSILTVEYKPIEYTVTYSGHIINVSKSKVTVNDKLTFEAENENGRTVTTTVNGTEIKSDNFKYSINIADYITKSTTSIKLDATWANIVYKITSSVNVTVSANTATIDDLVEFTVEDKKGYKPYVEANGEWIPTEGNKGSFWMKKFAKDVYITATYDELISYNITTDEGITATSSQATMQDAVYLYYTEKEGYYCKMYANNKLIDCYDGVGYLYMKDFCEDVHVSITYDPVYLYIELIDNYVSLSTKIVQFGDKVNYTTADRTAEGFEFKGILINGELYSDKSEGVIEFSNYSEKFEIGAKYDPIVYTIKIEPNSQEYLMISNLYPVAGEEITITVTPKENNNVELLVNGQKVDLEDYKYMFTYVPGDLNLETIYTPIQNQDPSTPVEVIEIQKSELAIYPNPARAGENVNIKVSGCNDLHKAKLMIYNSVGGLVMTIHTVEELNTINLKSGFYSCVLALSNQTKSIKFEIN